MGLPCKPGRSARAGGREKACGLRREAEVRFAQMQLARIMVAPLPIPVLLTLCDVRRVGCRGRYGKLSVDFLQRGLAVWEPELVTK